MPIPDRQKQRREYLRKKAEAIGLCLACSVFMFPTVVLATACGLATGYFIYGWIESHDIRYMYGSIATFLLAIILGAMCRAVYREFTKELDIPYVPPVVPNTLPAEEVLVRSSQEPEQEQSAILLRAVENTDTPSEELLRASNLQSQRTEL